METKKLFYENAYLREFDAKVVDICIEKNNLKVALDKTAFYPEGGGQACDTGIIKTGDKTFNVVDVHEKDGIIWHTLNSGDVDSFKVGSDISGKINWERRFDQMQQHSGEHIVSGMICSHFNCDNIGFHVGSDAVIIDYNAKISLEEAKAIEAKANKYIWENHAFEQLWPTPDKLKEIDYRSKKELTGAVRIARFPDADTCACCGIHVKTSAEVGLVILVSAHPFHEGSRLELYCGERALKYLLTVQQENKAISVLLSTKEHETSSATSKLLEENLKLKTEKVKIEDEYINILASTFEGKENALIISEWISPDMGRRLADELANIVPGICAVFCKASDGEIFRYSIIKRDGDVSDFVKRMNQALEGKGGGRAGFAQGTLNASKDEIENYFQSESIML